MRDPVDLAKFPIHAPTSDGYRAMLADIRAKLTADGCAVLKGFIRGDALGAFVAEADQVADGAHRSHSRTNAYFSQPDATFPAEHPVNRFYDRSNAFIPADNFPADGPLRQLYERPDFMPFVRDALDEPEEKFFRYDDPLADVIINMVEEGDGFPWHFDTNNFTLTLAIQNAEAGGAFEYAPHIRTPTEENYAAVAEILDGRRERVRTLALEPGDLQIFKGRYALHRVAPAAGRRRRYVGIFSFVEKEGMCGGVERTKQLYGRVSQRHIERAGWRDDALRD